jgi:hypothetical protein
LVADTVDIVDPKFDKYFSIEYTLSILIGMDSFFYFIEDSLSNALVLKQIRYQYTDPKPSLQQKELELQRILMTENLLQLPYAQVNICYSTSNFTLIPDEIYSKHQNEAYLRQVTRVNDTQAVAVYYLKMLNLHIVYSVDKVVVDIVKSYFPGGSHMHIVAPLIMQSHEQCRKKDGLQLCLHVGNGIMGLILFDGGHMKLVNTFPYKSDLDFMYYTLMVYDQFNLDPKEVPVYITGRSNKKTSTYDQMSKYVRHIEVVRPPSYYQYSTSFEHVDLHFYSDLLSMKLCV